MSLTLLSGCLCLMMVTLMTAWQHLIRSAPDLRNTPLENPDMTLDLPSVTLTKQIELSFLLFLSDSTPLESYTILVLYGDVRMFKL